MHTVFVKFVQNHRKFTKSDKIWVSVLLFFVFSGDILLFCVHFSFWSKIRSFHVWHFSWIFDDFAQISQKLCVSLSCVVLRVSFCDFRNHKHFCCYFRSSQTINFVDFQQFFTFELLFYAVILCVFLCFRLCCAGNVHCCVFVKISKFHRNVTFWPRKVRRIGVPMIDLYHFFGSIHI